jgi:hypothetical protein
MGTECERRGRFAKIKFAARDMIGTAVSDREEVYRVRYERGFCEFGLTKNVYIADPDSYLQGVDPRLAHDHRHES